jgi:hypothetical protein
VKNGAGGNSFVDHRGMAGEPGWGASKLEEFAMERWPFTKQSGKDRNPTGFRL